MKSQPNEKRFNEEREGGGNKWERRWARSDSFPGSLMVCAVWVRPEAGRSPPPWGLTGGQWWQTSCWMVQETLHTSVWGPPHFLTENKWVLCVAMCVQCAWIIQPGVYAVQERFSFVSIMFLCVQGDRKWKLSLFTSVHIYLISLAAQYGEKLKIGSMFDFEFEDVQSSTWNLWSFFLLQ